MAEEKEVIVTSGGGGSGAGMIIALVLVVALLVVGFLLYQNGAFSLHGLTPGSYQVYSWRCAPASGFRNEGFMKQFAGQGRAVTLQRYGEATVELKTLDLAP